MKNLKYSVGIDVSMKDFACCLSVINDEQDVKVKASHKFANTQTGFVELLEWIKRHQKEVLPITFVMEATWRLSRSTCLVFTQQRKTR